MDVDDLTTRMEFLSTSPPSTADDSSCDDSTGPTTPESISPLLGAARVEDVLETPLDQYLSCLKPSVSKIAAKRLPFNTAQNQKEALFSKPVKHIAVVGAGYVGGPTAAVIALHNPHIQVDVLDKDPRRVRRWNSPHLPIYEPGLADIVRVSRDGASARLKDASLSDTPIDRIPNLYFTTDSQTSLAKADVVMLAVNTPTKTFGVGSGRATNMTTFDAAAKEVAQYARPGTIIVEKSTVPCGTAQRVRKMLDEVRPGVPFEIISNPEFLSEGTAVRNLMHPDRVLIGSCKTPSGRRAAEALANVYAAWVPRPRILEVNAWSSELAKLVSNAMLAQRISSINSISAICDKTGADIDEIAKSAGIDPRIGSQFLKAGLGFGGSCFRKDISSLTYLAESLGLPEVAHYWSQVNSMNEWQRDRFAYKVVQRLEENLVGKKIALLGFAFKKNTGDTRESLAVDVIRVLLRERPGEIAIFDPCCLSEDIMRELEPILDPTNRDRVHTYTDAYLACQQAQAVVVINDSDPFRQSPAQQDTSTAESGRRNPYHESTSHHVSETPVEDNNMLFIEGNRFCYKPGESPSCAEDCPDCQSTKLRGTMSSEPVQWARIADVMKDPKWIFDGRGVLDVPEMQKLGYRVETLGRQTQSRQVAF